MDPIFILLLIGVAALMHLLERQERKIANIKRLVPIHTRS